jgi:tetratricopeptide (TPR) repeat protein
MDPPILAVGGGGTLGPVSIEGVLSFWFGAPGRDAAERCSQPRRCRALGPENPETARYLWRLAIVEGFLRNRHEAVKHLRRALAIREKALGPTNLQSAYVLTNLGTNLISMGEAAEGLQHLERSEKFKEEALGPEHPDVQSALSLLAWGFGRAGRLPEAEAAARRALALNIRLMGEERSFIDLAILSEILWSREKYEEACAAIDRAVVHAEKGVPQVRERGRMLGIQGRCLRRRGDLARAQAVHERALSLVEEAHGPTSVDLADHLGDLGDVLLARGKARDAVAAYERAVALLEQGAASPRSLAVAQFGLGLALRAAGQGARAAPLLERAGPIIMESPETNPELARLVRRTQNL